MTKEMSRIISCDAIQCAYNTNRQCHTVGITVGDGKCPLCDTALKADQKGGISDMTGGVGACKVAICEYNESLECTAPGINVCMHEDHPECCTFEQR
ncbi:MAG: DUF1540 domain-containing protein [Candidatus Omnitrophota bacterium]